MSKIVSTRCPQDMGGMPTGKKMVHSTVCGIDLSNSYFTSLQPSWQTCLIFYNTVLICLFKAQTNAPCLSFDMIPDNLGDSRTEVWAIWVVTSSFD